MTLGTSRGVITIGLSPAAGAAVPTGDGTMAGDPIGASDGVILGIGMPIIITLSMPATILVFRTTTEDTTVASTDMAT